MAFWVYILRCRDGAYYIGHTDNLERRLAQHQSGEMAGFTHDRRPVELAYSAEVQSREEALTLELKLKGWSRRKKAALIREDWSALSRFAKGKHRHERS